MKHIIGWSIIFSLYYSMSLVAVTALWVLLIPSAPQWVHPPLSFVVAAGWALVISFARHVLPQGLGAEGKAEVRRQTDLIDAHIRGLMEMGFSRSDAQRVITLKQREWWYDGLSRSEREELAELAKKIRPAPSPQQDQQTQADWLRRAAE